MNNITFGAGVLFVGSPGEEFQPIGAVEEMDLDAVPITGSVSSSEEATLTITLTQEMIDALIERIHHAREIFIDLARDVGYSRIAHLAKHGWKHRTRKKNLHRVYRILGRR